MSDGPRQTESRLPESRLLLVLQVVCAGSAIASLPRGLIHPFWLLTFILPAAFFLFLGTGMRQRLLPTWFRFSVAALTQASAAYLTYRVLGPLDEKSSLACSLLPALTYFTLRREPSDTSLSLFLSFCFLLIGIMLNNDAADWTLLLFLGSCAWAMQIESSNRALLVRHSARGKEMTIWTRLLRRSHVILALMTVSFLLYQGLGWIPSPGKSTNRTGSRAATGHGGRVMGLNSRFDLSGSEGSPLNLTSDRVLLVTNPRGSVPPDLYLRMTYFDRPGLPEWVTWPPTTAESDVRLGFNIREWQGRTERLNIQRLVRSRVGEMYVPPGAVHISGMTRLVFNRHSGYYVSPNRGEMGYRVRYQRPHKRRNRRTEGIDPTFADENYVELPDYFRTPELEALKLDVDAPRLRHDPLRFARHISEYLQQRYTYNLREPSGPYDDVVHNFLFGSKKEGFCMHFATALAILLRLHDIPCRIAVGLHAGDEESNGARVFGSQHAHAWVELPLRKSGWVLVDPTPPGSRTERGWPDPDAVQPSPDEGGNGDDPGISIGSLFDGFKDPLANATAFLVLAVAFLGLTLGLIVIILRRARNRERAAGASRPTPDSVRARRMLEQILSALAKCGYPKAHRATLDQYLRALESDDELDIHTLADAFRAYHDVRFGAKMLDHQRESRLMAGMAATRDA